MRNISITNSKEMIGEAMYNYMKENGMNVDWRFVKLNQLLDTILCKSGRNDKENNGFIAISYYYLWFLIDNGFIVDDVKSMMIFSKHTRFKGFVEEFIRLRQQAIPDKNKELGNFYKLCLNSSYGQEIINEEKFSKVMLCNTHHRLNIAGESEITKVKINENKLEIDHTNNIITHCMGVDANSLYPSCFSSSINPNIPYTEGQMYMLGRLLQSFKCDTEKQKAYALNIINEKKELFITEVNI
jgi:hypothetical protein